MCLGVGWVGALEVGGEPDLYQELSAKRQLTLKMPTAVFAEGQETLHRSMLLFAGSRSSTLNIRRRKPEDKKDP